MRRVVWAFLLLAVVLGMITACGGGGDKRSSNWNEMVWNEDNWGAGQSSSKGE